MCSELWMAVMTSVVWPKGRIRRLSLKIHPLDSPFFEESSLFFWLIVWSKARREQKDRWGN
jgi:hypothetical protein